MKTVNSLSGGKTSAYIAAHYPADYDIFSLVCIGDPNAGRHIDKKLRQRVNDKLQKYCPHMPEFVATSEDPAILKTMFDLEQYIGREIIWLRGMDWETMLKVKRAVPNQFKRFCSYMLKMIPFFEFLFMRNELPVRMRIGYRYDEKERKNTFTETYRYAKQCNIYWDEDEVKNPVIRKSLSRHPNGFLYYHSWEEIYWRIGEFPLIEERICHHQVQQYWKHKGILFPEDSNCQNCFWKDVQQLRKNYDTNRPIMLWAAVQEAIMGNTFKNGMSLLQVRNLGLQLDFYFGTGSGCQAGFCTD